MRTKWILLTLLSLAPIGCVEDVKAKSTAEPATEAPLPKPKDPEPTWEPTEGDFVEPALTAAKAASSRVAHHEEQIDSGLTAMIEDLPLSQSTQELLDAVKIARLTGSLVLDRQYKLKPELAAIAKAHANLQHWYTNTKEMYQKKARGESGEIKERYLILADSCDALIRANAERSASYATFSTEFDKAVARLKRDVQFLTDTEQYLSHSAAVLDEKSRKELFATLDRCAADNKQFSESLTQFRDKMRDGAVSKKLRDEHERTQKRSTTPEPSMAVPGIPMLVEKEPLVVESEEKKPAPSEPVPSEPAVRYEQRTVTHCVSVPVTCYSTRGLFGRRTVAHTEYRHQLVTETVLVPVNP